MVKPNCRRCQKSGSVTFTPGSPYHRDGELPVPRPVELAEIDRLPGAERELPSLHRDGLGEPSTTALARSRALRMSVCTSGSVFSLMVTAPVVCPQKIEQSPFCALLAATMARTRLVTSIISCFLLVGSSMVC